MIKLSVTEAKRGVQVHSDPRFLTVQVSKPLASAADRRMAGLKGKSLAGPMVEVPRVELLEPGMPSRRHCHSKEWGGGLFWFQVDKMTLNSQALASLWNI